MTTLIDVTGYLLPLASTVVVAGFAWRIRYIDEPGIRWFRALLGTFAFTTLVQFVLVGGLPVAGVADGDVAYTIYLLTLFLYMCAVVVWFLFALEYTGRVTPLSTSRGALFAFPLLFFLHNIPGELGIVVLPGHDLIAEVNTLSLLYFGGLLAIGSYLVLRTTHEYGHLSLRQGVVVVGAIIGLFVGIRWGFLLQVDGAAATAVAAELSGVYLVTGLAFVGAVTVLDLFESTPAAGNVGERAIASTTDDLIVLTDHRNRIIKLNEAAAGALGVTTTVRYGDEIDDLLDVSVAELQELQTVELQTETGKRQFDPQVSELTDQHDRWLGYLVSLRDVTDREIRKQRLEVLNRVLRHNLRNKLNVVTGRANEVARVVEDDELESHLDVVVEEATYLTGLGEKAKQIEALLAETREGTDTHEQFHLGELVADVAETARTRSPHATVETGEIPDVAVRTDYGLLEFALGNVVENAVEHADSEEPWVEIAVTVDDEASHYPLCIEVRDDGPGVPAHEIDVLEQGKETVLEHGSGLGLWVTTWALTELGGELSFAERKPRGSVVSLHLPHVSLSQRGNQVTEQ